MHVSGTETWLVCKVGCIECGVIEEPALAIIGMFGDEQQAVETARKEAHTIAQRWGMTNPEQPYAVRANQLPGSRLGAGWMWTPADHEQVFAVRVPA